MTHHLYFLCVNKGTFIPGFFLDTTAKDSTIRDPYANSIEKREESEIYFRTLYPHKFLF